jgi:hypothetical protein
VLLHAPCLQALRKGVRSAIAAASGAAGDMQLQDNDTIKVGSLAIRCVCLRLCPGCSEGRRSVESKKVLGRTSGGLYK